MSDHSATSIEKAQGVLDQLIPGQVVDTVRIIGDVVLHGQIMKIEAIELFKTYGVSITGPLAKDYGLPVAVHKGNEVIYIGKVKVKNV